MNLVTTDDQSDYELLRDVIIEAFNPPDDDRAEVSIMSDAIAQAVKFIRNLDCDCDPRKHLFEDGADVACMRCQVLGRFKDEEIER